MRSPAILGRRAHGRCQQVAEERRAAARQVFAQRIMQRLGWSVGVGCRGHSRGKEGQAVGPVERDPSVITAQRAGAQPDDLACRAQLVEQARAVAAHARRQHVAFQHARRQRHALQLGDHLRQAAAAAAVAAHTVPARQEACQRLRLDRLDLAPQPRQRAPAQHAQHVRVAPLALDAAGPELAAHHPARGKQSLEC